MDELMTLEEHRARHQELHRMLDELVADFINHQPRERHGFLDVTIGELMEWSFEQSKDPTPGRD